jgi:uncharacterized HAD superfamily protein
MAELKTFVVDIDNTICTQTYGDYSKAKPYKDRIKKVNSLHEEGHKIIYFTARGMGRTDDDQVLSYAYCYQETYEQLVSWGCKFHRLMLGKPYADYYIDDKAISDTEFFK